MGSKTVYNLKEKKNGASILQLMWYLCVCVYDQFLIHCFKYHLYLEKSSRSRRGDNQCKEAGGQDLILQMCLAGRVLLLLILSLDTCVFLTLGLGGNDSILR